MTPHPHTFVCQASAQPDPRSGPLTPLGEIRMTEPTERSVSGGGFKFSVTYGNDGIEGLVIYTFVYSEPTGKIIEHSYFRFDPQKGPVNQFGSQGFTGLRYVLAPDSSAELQYICKVDD